MPRAVGTAPALCQSSNALDAATATTAPMTRHKMSGLDALNSTDRGRIERSCRWKCRSTSPPRERLQNPKRPPHPTLFGRRLLHAFRLTPFPRSKALQAQSLTGRTRSRQHWLCSTTCPRLCTSFDGSGVGLMVGTGFQEERSLGRVGNGFVIPKTPQINPFLTWCAPTKEPQCRTVSTCRDTVC